MKYAHLIKINVFSKQEDDENTIIKRLLSLIPFDIEEQRVELKKRTAEGFEHKTIKVFEITLTKEKHVNAFLENLNKKLTNEQKELLLRQAESRLDKDLNFFLRLDKDKLIKEEKLWTTDSGNCFHIKISIAAFPKKRDIALEIIKKLLI